MSLSSSQRRVLEDWLRTKGIVRCPCCAQEDGWRFTDAAYVRALLEEGDEDLTEGGGVVKVACDNCGYLMLFDAQTIGIRGMWGRGRNL